MQIHLYLCSWIRVLFPEKVFTILHLLQLLCPSPSSSLSLALTRFSLFFLLSSLPFFLSISRSICEVCHLPLPFVWFSFCLPFPLRFLFSFWCSFLVFVLLLCYFFFRSNLWYFCTFDQFAAHNANKQALKTHTCTRRLGMCVWAKWLAAFQYGANWVFNCLTLHFANLLSWCVARIAPGTGSSDTLHFVLQVAAVGAAAVGVAVVAVVVVIVYPFCHIYLVGLGSWRESWLREIERAGKGRDAGPVISIYNLILSNDNDDNSNSSSNLQQQQVKCCCNQNASPAIDGQTCFNGTAWAKPDPRPDPNPLQSTVSSPVPVSGSGWSWSCCCCGSVCGSVIASLAPNVSQVEIILI